MPDKYANFAQLAQGESASVYAISYRSNGSPTVVVAPHGGGIEAGTSEVCVRVAGEDLSWYRFDGCKATNNRDLHITSCNFDEPQCMALIGASRRVLTIHGEAGTNDVVYVGGRHQPTIDSLQIVLREAGFSVQQHRNPQLQGRHPGNICNRGQLGEGVQLELSLGLRRTFFSGLACSGREQRTACFDRFCAAVRHGLEKVNV